MFHFPDGYELPSDGRQKIFANGTLIINQALKSTDEGYYTCTAFSRRDEEHSGNVHIQVLSKYFLNVQSMFKYKPVHKLHSGLKALFIVRIECSNSEMSH